MLLSLDITMFAHNPFIRQVCIWCVGCALPCAMMAAGDGDDRENSCQPQTFPSPGAPGTLGLRADEAALAPAPCPPPPMLALQVRIGVLYTPHPDFSAPPLIVAFSKASALAPSTESSQY